MSKITNDGLTRSGTECFIVVCNSGRQRVNFINTNTGIVDDKPGPKAVK